MKMNNLKRVTKLVERIDASCLGVKFKIRCERDVMNKEDGRVFIQFKYESPCSKTDVMEEWKGRKWYLTEFMTDDEVIKSIYSAFEQAIKHEILEGFKVDGIILFNSHIDFEELLKISHLEVGRI